MDDADLRRQFTEWHTDVNTQRRCRIWIQDVDRLHELLATYGDDAMRIAFRRGLEEQEIGAEYIAHYLGRMSPAVSSHCC